VAPAQRRTRRGGAHLGNGPWDDDLHEIEAAYLRSGGEFLVGVLDGKVVAMGTLRRISPGKAEIKRMRVGPRPRDVASGEPSSTPSTSAPPSSEERNAVV
jgi:hypothetical protein